MELNENLFLEYTENNNVNLSILYQAYEYGYPVKKLTISANTLFDAMCQLFENLNYMSAEECAEEFATVEDMIDYLEEPDIGHSVIQIKDVKTGEFYYDKYDEYFEQENLTPWKKVDSKEVKDSDGFMTEYTWYTNDAEDTHIFIFGDSDIYGPDDSYADAEFDSYDLAKEWFDNYYGFDYDEEDPDWVEFAEDRPAIEESAVNETYYAVIEVDGEERKFPFDNRDMARDYIAKARSGELPEFEGKKIGSTYTENFNVVSEEVKPNIESEELQTLAKKHNIKILDAMSNGDLRMEGAGADLMKFYQEAEKLGLWQVDPSLYECNNKVNETLTMHNFDEFKAIADEVGLVTAEDLERFRKEEIQPGESELDAIKRYKQELIDAGVDLSTLVNESIIRYPNGMEVTDVDLDTALSYMYGIDRNMDNSVYTDEEKQRAVDYWIKKTEPAPQDNLNEGAVKEVAMDIEAKEKELADLKGQLDQLKSYDRKECGAGGPYDSTTELDAEISETESSIEKIEAEIAELKAKVSG